MVGMFCSKDASSSESMTAIPLKLPEDLLDASGRCAEYIRRALERMNGHTRARLREASQRVQEDSVRINREFAAFERGVD